MPTGEHSPPGSLAVRRTIVSPRCAWLCMGPMGPAVGLRTAVAALCHARPYASLWAGFDPVSTAGRAVGRGEVSTDRWAVAAAPLSSLLCVAVADGACALSPRVASAQSRAQSPTRRMGSPPRSRRHSKPCRSGSLRLVLGGLWTELGAGVK